MQNGGMQLINSRRASEAHISTGLALLRRTGWNKDLAFSHEERRQWKLCGLLPAAVETQVMQLDRVRVQLDMMPDPVLKYLVLRDLRDRNERLFFQLCAASPEEMLPLIYTPTIGTICQRFSELYRFPRVRPDGCPAGRPQVLTAARMPRGLRRHG